MDSAWFRSTSLRVFKFLEIKDGDRIFLGNQYCRLRRTFLRVVKFLQIKEGESNFWGEPIFQKVWFIWLPLLYFNFKRFMDTISASFIRFQCALPDSGVLFSESSKFYKLKRRDVISRGNQFCRKSELFGCPFWISILKVWWAQFLRHSLDFNSFCMIQEHFSRSLEISKGGGPGKKISEILPRISGQLVIIF